MNSKDNNFFCEIGSVATNTALSVATVATNKANHLIITKFISINQLLTDRFYHIIYFKLFDICLILMSLA